LVSCVGPTTHQPYDDAALIFSKCEAETFTYLCCLYFLFLTPP